MITTNEFDTKKISLGSLQDKKSKNGKKYQNIPILYDGRKAIVRLHGRFSLRHDLSFAVEVDADNRKLFEEFEEKLQSLSRADELKLIKYGRVYLKIYLNEGKMAPKFWKVFEKNGKEYKKEIRDKESLIGENIEGEIVFSFANIFVGGEARRGKTQKSIICVAKEILVKVMMEEKSYFEEYPVGEDDSEEED